MTLSNLYLAAADKLRAATAECQGLPIRLALVVRRECQSRGGDICRQAGRWRDGIVVTPGADDDDPGNAHRLGSAHVGVCKRTYRSATWRNGVHVVWLAIVGRSGTRRFRGLKSWRAAHYCGGRAVIGLGAG